MFNVSHKIFRDFDKTIPAVWFTLFELKLQQCALATDEERRNTLLSCLPNDVLLIVHDILVNQPSYQRIKQCLIQWFEPNLSSRVSELLGCTTVPEEKPSQFLLTLRTKLAQSDMPEAMIRELFIAKMPEHLRNCLIVMKNVSLEELAVTADQMITNSGKTHIEQSLFAIKQDKKNSCSSAEQCDEVSWRINSLESKLNKIVNLLQPSSSESSLNIPTSGHMRSDSEQFKSSQTNNHPRNICRLNQTCQNICWYHQTFGTSAKKCSPPCNFAAGNRLRPLQ